MSHFTVLVVGKNPEKQLSPYDENIEVYVTKKEKQDFIDYYTKDKNPEGINDGKTFAQLYKEHGEGWNNNEWKSVGHGKLAQYSTYNKLSKWDWYSLGGRWTGFFKLKEGKTGEVGEEGLMTQPAKEGFADSALKGNVDLENSEQQTTFAIVKDGKWIEKGKMGWWACVSDEDKNWDKKFKKIWDSIKDDELVSLYDCHI